MKKIRKALIGLTISSLLLASITTYAFLKSVATVNAVPLYTQSYRDVYAEESADVETYDPCQKLSEIEILEPTSVGELLRDIEIATSGRQEKVYASLDNLDFHDMDDMCNHWKYIFDSDMVYGGKNYYSDFDMDKDTQYYPYTIGKGPDGERWYFDFDEETLEMIPVAPVAGTYDERTDRDDYFYCFSMQNYMYPQRHYTEHQREAHSAAKSAASQCKRDTDVDTMNAIVDYIQNNVDYAHDVVKAVYGEGKETQEYWEVFDVYGALVQHHAVCEGMAYATGLIARYCGVPCVIVFTEQHAWNAFKTSDGSVYMLDPTSGKYAYEPTGWPSNRFCTESSIRKWLDLKEEMIGGSGMSSGSVTSGSTGKNMTNDESLIPSSEESGHSEKEHSDNDRIENTDTDNNMVYNDNKDNRGTATSYEDTNVSGQVVQRGPATDLQSGKYYNAPYTVTNGASSVTADKGKIKVSFIDRQGGLTYNVKIRSALQSLSWSTYTSTNPDMEIKSLSKGRYEVCVMANAYHSDGQSDNGWTYPIVVEVQ